MQVKDLICSIMDPKYFNLDTEEFIKLKDLQKILDYYVVQISADQDKQNNFYVLIDVCKEPY